MALKPRSLQEVADATLNLARDPVALLGDLYADKAIPVRALVMLSAKEIANRILFPARAPTLNWSEYIPTLAAEGLASDFEARNLWLETPVVESEGWRIVSHVHGAASFDWGVTFLGTGYHDFSAQTDVDFFVRLAGLQLSLAAAKRKFTGRLVLPPSAWYSHRTAATFERLGFEVPPDLQERLSWSWPEDAPVGGVVARMVDSREYGVRTSVLQLTNALQKEYTDYYYDKARVIGRAVDRELPHVALNWDRENPRDNVHGYVFQELDAPTADVEAVLMMKWSAKKREYLAKKDISVANAEVAHAFSRGTLLAKRYILPDGGVIASVSKPSKGHRMPTIRFTRNPDAEIDGLKTEGVGPKVDDIR